MELVDWRRRFSFHELCNASWFLGDWVNVNFFANEDVKSYFPDLRVVGPLRPPLLPLIRPFLRLTRKTASRTPGANWVTSVSRRAHGLAKRNCESLSSIALVAINQICRRHWRLICNYTQILSQLQLRTSRAKKYRHLVSSNILLDLCCWMFRPIGHSYFFPSASTLTRSISCPQ